MKYGSGGFNPYGYKAGCAFVSGTFEETLADAVAGRFLCSPDNAGTVSCFSDFSGQAVCTPQRRYRMQVYDDLYTVDLVRTLATGACGTRSSTSRVCRTNVAFIACSSCRTDYSRNRWRDITANSTSREPIGSALPPVLEALRPQQASALLEAGGPPRPAPHFKHQPHA